MSWLIAPVIVTLVWFFWISRQTPQTGGKTTSAPARRYEVDASQMRAMLELEQHEKDLESSLWRKEVLSQNVAEVFESLWNSINSSTNRWVSLADFPFERIILPNWTFESGPRHNIEITSATPTSDSVSPIEWKKLLQSWATSGWQLNQVEIRHIAFDTDEWEQPFQSQFAFTGHLENELLRSRFIIEGQSTVRWSSSTNEVSKFEVKSIDATNLKIKRRSGTLPFKEFVIDRVSPSVNAYSVDPLLLYDLDHDGRPEIILAGKNTIYRQDLSGMFQPYPLCKHPKELISNALIGDFDSDGHADFLVQLNQGLYLFHGNSTGNFSDPCELAWRAPPQLRYPMAFTCGDIDADGDLDLFIGQYRVPYESGSMPTPFYNSLDGYPAFILKNDGKGHFADSTASSALGTKRNRRTYSASWVDLDADLDLDLLVTSDFCGVDVYENDGHGILQDVTHAWITEPHAFGMAHAFSDFDRDGQADFLMTGMTSPTVDRLEHLKLHRNDQAEARTMRPKMTAGNRLYLAKHGAKGFDEITQELQISRSGWSWGCAAADFDNDGYPDVYVGNGLETRESVRDYESEYWLHDQFVGDSSEDPIANLYFKSVFGRTRGKGQSYGGYEINRLFLNIQGKQFFEAAHLFGVALQDDTRNVIAQDVNDDGRVDLVVTSFGKWPDARTILRVYLNQIPDVGNWIGFRFSDRNRGYSPVGAQIRIWYGDHTAVSQIVAGDGYRSQQANQVHFGIGKSSEVEKVEIRWPRGGKSEIKKPAVNRYHPIEPFIWQ